MEVAKRYRYADGSAEFGLITSVTQPFCGGCTRARISADGQALYLLVCGGGARFEKFMRSEGYEKAALFDLAFEALGRAQRSLFRASDCRVDQPNRRSRCHILGG